jgi:hypothetical protein
VINNQSNENECVYALLETIYSNQLYISKDEIIFNKKLDNLRKYKEESYTTFKISKKLGGVRKINAPNDYLKSELKKVSICLDEIYKLKNHSCVFGYIKNSQNNSYGIISNANIHLGSEWILNFDLLAFFDSIDIEKVKLLFLSAPFNYNLEEANFLAELVTYNGHLTTGSPASPIISNFVFFEADQELKNFAISINGKYSRYADDISFSFNDMPSDDNISKIFRIVNKFGFKVNYKKFNLRNKNNRQLINGLIVNQKINVKKEYYKSLRAALYNLSVNFKIESERYIKLNHLQYKKFICKTYKYYYKTNYTKEVLFDYSSFENLHTKRLFIYYSIEGKITFIQHILGKEDKKVKFLYSLFKKIFNEDIPEIKEPLIPKDICYITNATAKSVVFYAYLFLKHNKIDEPKILQLLSDCSIKNTLDQKLLHDKFLKQSIEFIYLYDYLNNNNRFENFIKSHVNSGLINTIVKYWEGTEKFMTRYYRRIFHTSIKCELLKSDYDEEGIHIPNTGIFATDKKIKKDILYAINREFLEKLKMRNCKGCDSM